MRSIPQLRAQDAYRQACAMERPLERIRNFAAALASGEGASVAQELTLAIAESLDELDDIHGFFFRLHHPDRERFEREGWPSEQAAEADHA
jgi:hypothetical protein